MPTLQAPVTACPGCQSQFKTENVQILPYPMEQTPPAGVRKPERIWVCPDCGLGVADPLFTSDEEKIIYSGGTYWKEVTSKIDLKRIALPLSLAANRFSFANEFLQNSPSETLDVLDIGSGQGGFGLAASREWGAKLGSYVAVEPDPRMRSELKALWTDLKIPTPLKIVSDLNEVEGRFDLIVFSHVVEHVRTPVDILRDVQKRLKPQGLVLVEVPNQDQEFKKDVYPHVLFFSKPSLARVFKNAGYGWTSIDSYGHSRRINPLGKFAPFYMKWVTRVASRLRRFIPLSWSRALFNLAFGGHRVHQEGIWLRAVARVN